MLNLKIIKENGRLWQVSPNSDCTIPLREWDILGNLLWCAYGCPRMAVKSKGAYAMEKLGATLTSGN